METVSYTHLLVKMSSMVAISIVLVYLIHFPIFPAVAFLEYDPADISILIGTFAFGPAAGVLLTLVTVSYTHLDVYKRQAHQSLLEMGAEEYFSFIEQMVRQSALPKEGEIRFSERDLKRLPDGFDKRLNQAAAERGGCLLYTSRCV